MASNARVPDAPQPGAAWTVAYLVAAGVAVPILIYELTLGSVATVTPARAREMLRQQGDATVLVDVRRPEVFSRGHLEGAVSWPLEEILATSRPDEIPPRLRQKKLLLICDVGWASCLATRHLAASGVQDVLNVRGGIQEWIHSAPGLKGETFDRWQLGPGRVVELPSRPAPLREQVAAFSCFFVVKPGYTLLSLAVVLVLWRSRAPDLVALRWGMIAFFLGENACAVNVLVFDEASYLLEYLHAAGMLVCFGFTTYAVLEGIDRRVLHVSDPKRRCAALGLCGACIKTADVPCGLKRVFYVIAAACMAVALVLPCADWQDTAYNTVIFGKLYHYAHLRVYQVFENWYCAAAAVLLFGASLAILLFKRHDPIGPAKIAFAAGAGPLAFGWLRMTLGGAFDQNRVWYAFWEETTELLFLLAVCGVLWIFCDGLLPKCETAGTDGESRCEIQPSGLS